MYFYKRLKWFTLSIKVNWLRWVIGIDIVPGMYRPVDQFDMPGAGDKKGRVKYQSTEVMFLIGPLFIAVYW